MMLPPSGEIHLSPNFPNLNHAVPRHGSLPNVSAGVNHVLVMNKGLLISGRGLFTNYVDKFKVIESLGMILIVSAIKEMYK